MANQLDIFAYVLHGTLEGLEQELVQTVRDRVLKEGSAFPGKVSKIQATVEVDLNSIVRSAASCRVVKQVEGK